MNKHTVGKEDTSDINTNEKVATELARAFNALEVGDFRLVIEIAKELLRINENIPQAH